LEEAVHRADAVVVAMVVSMRNHQPTIAGASLYTAYGIQVMDTLKNHGQLSAEFDVFRLGGDEDKGDHIRKIREHKFPDFKRGKRYVLFLNWNDVLDGYEPQYGANAVYEILADGAVDTPGTAGFAQAQRGKKKDVLLASVREAVKLKKSK